MLLLLTPTRSYFMVRHECFTNAVLLSNRIWNFATGECIQVLHGHNGCVAYVKHVYSHQNEPFSISFMCMSLYVCIMYVNGRTFYQAPFHPI